jgi:hypothetical protein
MAVMTDQSDKSKPPRVDILPDQQEAMARAALAGAAPRFYANGFILAQTASDLAIIMLANTTVAGVLNLSHISARSLADELQKALKAFEEATHQEVKSINEIQQQLGAAQK